MNRVIGVEAARRLDSLAKPVGSLGKLEELAVRLAETQQRLLPLSRPRTLIIFAGDHGVVEEGVGLWPMSLTRALVQLTLDGGSPSAVLARGSDTRLLLIDAGISGAPIEPHADYRNWRVGEGTANLARHPAMSEAQFEAAFAVGRRATCECVEAGSQVLAVGEIGIGNSTTAACLAALLTGAAVSEVVGVGAGATMESSMRKRAVVEAAVERGLPTLVTRPHQTMAALAGFEIVAIAGCVTEAAQSGITVVLDGFIAGVGALVAQALCSASTRTAIAAHLGAEPGHAVVLEHLGLRPFLDWQLRLGEGTGALLLLPMLDAASALLRDVANLDAVSES